MIIDISDLDFYTLVRELWIRASLFNYLSKPPTNEEIDQSMSSGYIDSLKYIPIKTDFSDLTKVDTNIYNLNYDTEKKLLFESIASNSLQELITFVECYYIISVNQKISLL